MEATGTAGDVRIFEHPEEVAHAAAEFFVAIAASAISARGLFTVALAGGATPRLIYQCSLRMSLRTRSPGPKVHIFFGDERCVEPTDAESNYRMADEALLSLLPIPSYNVHRISGEGDAVANASLYEDDLRTFFDLAPGLDLISCFSAWDPTATLLRSFPARAR